MIVLSCYDVIEALAPNLAPVPAQNAPLSFEEALSLERIARAIPRQGINSGRYVLERVKQLYGLD